MEAEKNGSITKPKIDEGSAQYPFYTIENCFPRLREIANHYGTGGSPVPRKDICILLGKAEPTLMNFFSSCFQYGLLNNIASKGVSVTDLFQKIENPIYGDAGKKAAMMEAIMNPPLYKKLIDTFNGKIIPNESGLANLFATKEYGVNSNSSIKAAKVFFENGKALDIIDASNRLRYIIPTLDGNGNDSNNNEEKPRDNEEKAPPPIDSQKMFELPIDLGSTTAFLKYPRNITSDEIEILKIMLDAQLLALAARQKKATKDDTLNKNDE